MAYRFQIAGNPLNWPRRCACCGADAQTRVRAPVLKKPGLSLGPKAPTGWDVPYCRACARHVAKHHAARHGLMFGAIAPVPASLSAWAMSGNGVVGLAAGVLAGLLGVALHKRSKSQARRLMSPGCCSPRPAVRYLEWRKSLHTFVFDSGSYVEAFLSCNESHKRPG